MVGGKGNHVDKVVNFSLINSFDQSTQPISPFAVKLYMLSTHKTKLACDLVGIKIP